MAIALYIDQVNTQRSAEEGRSPESEFIRESIHNELGRRWDDLSQEARDLLDEDRKANAGAGAPILAEITTGDRGTDA